MLKSREAWQAIDGYAPRGEWLPLNDLYDLVREHVSLDDSDLSSISNKRVSARWKRTVRNALQRAKADGSVEWDGKGRYRLR